MPVNKYTSIFWGNTAAFSNVRLSAGRSFLRQRNAENIAEFEAQDTMNELSLYRQQSIPIIIIIETRHQVIISFLTICDYCLGVRSLLSVRDVLDQLSLCCGNSNISIGGETGLRRCCRVKMLCFLLR